MSWLSFYDFFRRELSLACCDKLVPLTALSEIVGWVWMYRDIVILSERPDVCQLINGRLHSETGPSVRYADGFALYTLQGVRVPAWAIETPKDEIDAKRVLALENTEQRAAIMRHLGLHRFLDALKAEQIDADGDYRLYYLNVERRKIGPYLYMQCPSTGREFLEGVGDADKYDDIDPTIKTCKDALNWRFWRASKGKMNSGEVRFRA